MMRDDGQVGRHEPLSELLQQWGATPVPGRLDERVLAGYRRACVPLWRRFVTGSIRVPLPVAVSVLLAGGALLTARPGPRTPAAATPTASPAPNAPVEAPLTRSSLAGFRPVAEVTATVMTESE